MNLSYILIRLARRGLLAFCALFALLALLGSRAASLMLPQMWEQ